MKSYCYEVQVEALKKLDLDKWGKILMDKIKEKRLKIYLQIETTYQSENQNFIEEIARKHEDKYIRRVAISRIKDKNILFDIAKNDDENSLEATMKLTDINNIAYIYEMKKGNIGYTPEYKLQQKLANIIKKIKDIDLLIDISENNEYSICREEAIKRISDQNVLFDIAKNNENIRAKAVERITDQKLLIDIINNFEGEDIRRNVTEKIRDEKTLIDLAKNDKDWYVQNRAIKKITDENTLIDIAKNDKNYHVRAEAAKGITDQKILINIAENDKEWVVRCTALEKITDQKILIHFAKNDKESFVRRSVVRGITDKEVLKYLVKADFDKEVRESARIKLKALGYVFKYMLVFSEKESSLISKDQAEDMLISGLLKDPQYELSDKIKVITHEIEELPEMTNEVLQPMVWAWKKKYKCEGSDWRAAIHDVLGCTFLVVYFD